MGCSRCGNCCHSQTGWMTPDDLKRLASFLSLSEEEVAKRYLVVDYLADYHQGYRYVYAPARVNEFTGEPLVEPGTRVPWLYSEEYAPCIFWHPSGCQIHPVKPLECALYECDRATDITHPMREDIAALWDQSIPAFAELHRRYGLEHCRQNLAIETKIREIAARMQAGTMTKEAGWDEIDQLRLCLE